MSKYSGLSGSPEELLEDAAGGLGTQCTSVSVDRGGGYQRGKKGQ